VKDYTILLGMREEDISKVLPPNSNIRYQLSYTRSPRQTDKTYEKRVIRFKVLNDIIYLLIGFFDLPTVSDK
jgi:hypothetical protein